MISSAPAPSKIAIWKKIGELTMNCIAIFLLLATFSFAANAGVTVEAQVDTNKVEKDDSLTLSIIVSSDSGINVEEPELPGLSNFMILNKFVQNQTSSTYENGKFLTTQKRAFNYLISPQKTGAVRIDPISIKVNGADYKTQPITITVVAQGKLPKTAPNQQQQQQAQQDDDPFGQDPFSDEAQELLNQMLRRRGLIPDPRGGAKSIPTNDREAFFVTVEVDKTRAYVGEQVTAIWYLYTKGNLQNYDALKYPELRGFWKEEIEMPTRLNFEQVNVNGIPYNRALLLASALFPIGPGKKVIDSYKAKATVIDLRSSLGMFGLGRPQTYVKASKEMPIEVKPLPVEGRPKSFSGAVGQFKITGSLSSAETKVNQPVSLKIRFQGEGNIKVIELPALNLPQNLEVYDTKKEAQFLKTGQSFKEFEVLIVPRAAGVITIPAISLSYFDPKKGKYVSDSTPEFSLTVKPGEGTAFSGSPMNAPQSKSVETPDGIRGIKTAPTVALAPSVENSLWIFLFFLTWASGVIGVLHSWRRGQGQSLSELNRKRVTQKLKTARQFLKKRDYRSVGVECSNAVLNVLGTISGHGGASTALDAMLEKLAGKEEFKTKIRGFLNRCEVTSFAPSELSKKLHTDAEAKTLVNEAEKIISDLYRFEEASSTKEGPEL